MTLFISFEGGDGSGKTTQTKILHDRLKRADIHSLLIQEPGTTPLGKSLRQWLKRDHLEADAVSCGAEVLLFTAARAELVAKILKPSFLQQIDIVIADRYTDSTLAYQGYGRQISLEDIRVMNHFATQGISPSLTFLLDCPPEDGLRRTSTTQVSLPKDGTDLTHPRRTDQEDARRFEREPLDFHRRVRQGYLDMARSDPQRWFLIDAAKPMDEISDIILCQVLERLQKINKVSNTKDQI